MQNVKPNQCRVEIYDLKGSELLQNFVREIMLCILFMCKLFVTLTTPTTNAIQLRINLNRYLLSIAKRVNQIDI